MTDGIFFVRSGVEDDRAGLRQRRSQFRGAHLGTACDIAENPIEDARRLAPMRQAALAHGEQSMGRDRNCRSSKIKAARSNRSESKVVWLHRKRVIVHCSIPVSDRDDKLVILNEQRHDVPHWHWIDKELIILDAFSLNQCGWHVG